MPAEAIAPAAPAAMPKTVAPALPNAPKVEINVSQMKPSGEVPPPSKGSARERMMQELEKKAGQEPGTERKPVEKKETEVERAAPQEPEKAPEQQGESSEKASTETPETATRPGEEAKKKVNPWKLVEEHKAARAQAEAKMLELEKRAIPEAKWQEKEQALEKTSKRLQELEEEIKFVNYAKSTEFSEKYQKPYEQAWERAMSELGELTVGEGEVERPMNANDLLELVNMGLGAAHEKAVDKFGDLAPEVMAHRKEIKKMFDEQAAALERARKEGSERDKRRTEESTRNHSEMGSKIRETWSKANEEVSGDPKYGKYFTPVEGDEQVNQRLAKGFQLADRAFSENPTAPGLTSEERAAIVRRHAAVRNRAAAFGRLVYENTTKQARIDELEKIVKEYKGSEPERLGSQPEMKPQGKSTMSGVLDELRKRAKQV